ncbi:MAG: DUF1015 domain-containing protein, partial [Candidatus Altiarchaeales archaeon]|nr:DUF1015 domain-containing protein [Candidatus Altiarchaeales archaeon]
FNKKKVGDIRLVLTPPYDVISKEEEKVYSENSPYNIVRLILPEGGEKRYENSARLMEKWLKEGILVQDSKPALYLYETEFYLEDGEIRRRLGFMAAVKIEDYEKRIIVPHESTMCKPTEDRLNLMKATRANLEPIFSIYDDPKNIVRGILETESKRAPLLEFTDDSETKHKIWGITDESSIKRIQNAMSGVRIYIADGHHRYQASLDYTKKFNGKGSEHTLMFLVDTRDTGMVILPTHRVIKKLKKFEEKEFEKKLENHFDVTVYKFEKNNEGQQRDKMFKHLKEMKDQHALGIFAGDRKYYLVSLKDDNLIDKELNSGKSRAWRELDAAVLHYILMEKVLGFKTNGPEYEENILFVKDKEKAIEMIYEKKYRIAMFMNATKPEQVIKVADNGERMPQKSTYFYPKPLTGLVLRKME